MTDKPDGFLDQPITWRQHVTEMVMSHGVPWWLAVEAVTTVALESTGDHWDVVRTRQEWSDRDAAEFTHPAPPPECEACGENH